MNRKELEMMIGKTVLNYAHAPDNVIVITLDVLPDNPPGSARISYDKARMLFNTETRAQSRLLHDKTLQWLYEDRLLVEEYGDINFVVDSTTMEFVRLPPGSINRQYYVGTESMLFLIGKEFFLLNMPGMTWAIIPCFDGTVHPLDDGRFLLDRKGCTPCILDMR